MDLKEKNRLHNENIRNSQRTEEEVLEWIDCVVASVHIVEGKTILEVESTSGVKRITFNMSAHLRKGDIAKALVYAGKEVVEKPEFDETNQVWKKPSDQVYLVDRPLDWDEVAKEIKVLDGEGAVLCHYEGELK